MNRHHLVALFLAIVMAAIAILSLQPRVMPESDTLSYLAAMEALEPGSGSSADAFAYRTVVAGGGLWTVIGLSKISGSYESAWLFLNIMFYLISSILIYEIVRRLHGSHKVALISMTFLAGNYAMITYGLGYFMDIGGWLSYLVSALLVFLYSQSGARKFLWLTGLAIGLGGLFKEHAFLGAFLVFFYLAFENWRSPLEFLKKILPPAIIAAVPVAILHWIVYAKYNFTYLEWLSLNQAHYVYGSRIIEFIKAYGSLLNLLAILAIVGLVYFFKYRREVVVSPGPGKNNWTFVVCLFLSMLPVMFWPAITQRILFISVPAVVVLASYLFKRFESRLYIFWPVAVLYFVLSLYMDSFILNAVNLPI